MSPTDGIGFVKDFISIGKDLANLPSLILPQYRDAATALRDICEKILTANENTARWFHTFRYFDFQAADARAKFLATARDYEVLKSGSGFKQLKFSCHEIENIYHDHIAAKLGALLTDQQKQDEAGRVFSELSLADGTMVDYLQDVILRALDEFVGQVEPFVDGGDMGEAEKIRLQFKTDSAGIGQYLEISSNGLSDLMLKFSDIARSRSN